MWGAEEVSICQRSADTEQRLIVQAPDPTATGAGVLGRGGFQRTEGSTLPTNVTHFPVCDGSSSPLTRALYEFNSAEGRPRNGCLELPSLTARARFRLRTMSSLQKM